MSRPDLDAIRARWTWTSAHPRPLDFAHAARDTSALLAYVEELEAVIERAGIITGESADAILHELEHGTPDTPERRATFARADALYRAGFLSTPSENEPKESA